MRLPPVAIAALLTAACSIPQSDASDILDGKADDLDPSEVPALAPGYAINLHSLLTFCEAEDGECVDDAETAQLDGLARLSLVQDGAGIAGELELCFAMLTTPGGKRYATDTDAFSGGDPTARMEPFPVTGRVVAVDDDPTLSLDRAGFAVGMQLDDPVTDALATDEDDPRVVDLDEDGKPGISIKVSVGRVFLGARVVLERLRGRIGDDGVLSGAADIGGELAVYGDTIPFVNVGKKIDEALAGYAFPEIVHEVTLVPDDRSCADL